jgi:hypothetical protein
MDPGEARAEGAIRFAQQGVHSVGFPQAPCATAMADAILATDQPNVDVSS